MPIISRQLNVQKPSQALIWGLWGVVTFFYAFQYILRVCPSVMLGSIMQKYGINASNIGEFSAAYYMGYALMHIPIGLMLDRMRIKWVIAGSIFISVAGLLPLALSDSWALSVIGRFMVGAGSSGAILSVFKVTRMYFSDHWFSRMLGVSVTFGLFGAIYGSTPVDRLSQTTGWENVLLIFFGVGLVMILAVMFGTPKDTQTNKLSHDSIGKQLYTVLSNKRVFLTALFAGLMVGPLEGFADVWAVSFLETVYGYERAVATSLPPVIFLGMCLGSPLLAAIAEKYKAYYGVTLLSALGMAIIFVLLLTLKLNFYVVGILFFLTGMLSAYQVLVMYMNSKNADERYSSLVTSLTNMIVMAFGSVFHFMITRIMNVFWDGKVVENLAIYEPLSYTYGIAIIPVMLVIAFLGFLRLKPANSALKANI